MLSFSTLQKEACSSPLYFLYFSPFLFLFPPNPLHLRAWSESILRMSAKTCCSLTKLLCQSTVFKELKNSCHADIYIVNICQRSTDSVVREQNDDKMVQRKIQETKVYMVLEIQNSGVRFPRWLHK